jgi:hypothetical protein
MNEHLYPKDFHQNAQQLIVTIHPDTEQVLSSSSTFLSNYPLARTALWFFVEAGSSIPQWQRIAIILLLFYRDHNSA